MVLDRLGHRSKVEQARPNLVCTDSQLAYTCFWAFVRCVIVGHTSSFACKIRLLGCIVCFARPVAVAQRERRGEKVSASGVRLRKVACDGNLMRPRSHHILQSTSSDSLTNGSLASRTQGRQEFTQLSLACLMMYRPADATALGSTCPTVDWLLL